MLLDRTYFHDYLSTAYILLIKLKIRHEKTPLINFCYINAHCL